MKKKFKSNTVSRENLYSLLLERLLLYDGSTEKRWPEK
jgi:hypothetical protein